MENLQNENIQNENTEVQPIEEQKADQKFFSQEELNSIIEKRLAREKANFEAEKQKAEKLAQMTIEERMNAERLEQQAKLDQLLRQNQEYEQRTKSQALLKDYGLDMEFCDFVKSHDPEIMMANVKILKNAFDKAVAKQVSEKLKGSTPEVHKNTQTDTKVDIKNMSLAELNALYQQNPEAFKQLYGKK